MPATNLDARILVGANVELSDARRKLRYPGALTRSSVAKRPAKYCLVARCATGPTRAYTTRCGIQLEVTYRRLFLERTQALAASPRSAIKPLRMSAGSLAEMDARYAQHQRPPNARTHAGGGSVDSSTTTPSPILMRQCLASLLLPGADCHFDECVGLHGLAGVDRLPFGSPELENVNAYSGRFRNREEHRSTTVAPGLFSTLRLPITNAFFTEERRFLVTADMSSLDAFDGGAHRPTRVVGRTTVAPDALVRPIMTRAGFA